MRFCVACPEGSRLCTYHPGTDSSMFEYVGGDERDSSRICLKRIPVCTNLSHAWIDSCVLKCLWIDVFHFSLQSNVPFCVPWRWIYCNRSRYGNINVFGTSSLWKCREVILVPLRYSNSNLLFSLLLPCGYGMFNVQQHDQMIPLVWDVFGKDDRSRSQSVKNLARYWQGYMCGADLRNMTWSISMIVVSALL